MRAVRMLTDGTLYFCKAPQTEAAPPAGVDARVEVFSGPHPSGLVGTHIHFLDPVSRAKEVWHVGLQQILAIGALFRTGKLDATQVVSLSGPGAARPRLLKTRVGASLDELTEGELKEGEQRILSGSVLSGRAAAGEVQGYLGRFHQHVSVLPEDRERHFLGWMSPGGSVFSVTNLFLSRLRGGQGCRFTTASHGSPRAMVPIGLYEQVMPLDILPTFLLRSLVMDDLERAEQLGCLELDEEDLSLCSFVCPGGKRNMARFCGAI